MVLSQLAQTCHHLYSSDFCVDRPCWQGREYTGLVQLSGTKPGHCGASMSECYICA